MNSQGWHKLLSVVLFAGLCTGCRTVALENMLRSSEDHSAPVDSRFDTSLQAAMTEIREDDAESAIAPPRTLPSDTRSSDTAFSITTEEIEIPKGDDDDLMLSLVPEVIDNGNPLKLDDVVRSVQQFYPLLEAASLERVIADGKELAAWGEFDLRVKAFGIAAPEGFYKTYRNGIAVDKPLFHGGYLYSGYKIGDGNFEPWYGERETDEGGEFSAGFGLPLLKDRAIDKRRAELFQKELARGAVEPAVQAQMLEFTRIASLIYWSWVAAGRNLDAQRELLRNAQDRVQQIQTKVDGGDLARISRINNEQLIAARETKVIESERKLQETAIKLSLFVRGPDGQPIVVEESQLPTEFPRPLAPTDDQMADDIDFAISASPLLEELNFVTEQVQVELRQAKNMLLPKIDARVYAAKDVGVPASEKRDKTPFQLEAGLYGELPLKRREAHGKITAAQGKLAQISTKRQFVIDKITAAVQDSISALQAAEGRIDRAESNLKLARETLSLGRLQFDEGDIDLISLNIYEKAVTDAQLLLISAHADFFSALANYRVALSQVPGQGE